MAKPSKNSEIREQEFRFKAPEARSVVLVGDFTHWQAGGIPLSRGDQGVWRTSVKLQPGRHSYRFIVDGEWRDDPECTIRVANPFGGHDMVREAA